jgi:hypothetical protein
MGAYMADVPVVFLFRDEALVGFEPMTTALEPQSDDVVLGLVSGQKALLLGTGPELDFRVHG